MFVLTAATLKDGVYIVCIVALDINRVRVVMAGKYDKRSWYEISRFIGYDEIPPWYKPIKRIRWAQRQKRIYKLERELDIIYSLWSQALMQGIGIYDTRS